MNILIPDKWLREYLKTDATPSEIQKYLSLCGPSVERIETVEGEPVYDIEVTTNRVDMMSVVGIAREAAAILPNFAIKAKIKNTETRNHKKNAKPQNKRELDIKIVNDPRLCRRIMAVKIANIKIGPSPKWMQKRLIQVGQRPLNNAIDITNYVMWEIGHPVHAFDYDRLIEKKIVVREAKKGEKLITLDNKTHALKGGEVIFDDGKGKIIDLPGIMGTANTVITDTTKNILYFSENTDKTKIRQASMGLSIRSQAAVLNEKGVDPELMEQAIDLGINLYQEICDAKIGSRVVDIYPDKTKIETVILSWDKLSLYLNGQIDKKSAIEYLKKLGFSVKTTDNAISAIPPSWRSIDIREDVDLIEEIARIWGYYKFESLIPDGKLPQTDPRQGFDSEYKIKLIVKSLGYSEINTVPLISEKEIVTGKEIEYLKLLNPLGKEWEYLRRSLVPALKKTIMENERFVPTSLFEMGLVFFPNTNGKLPTEQMQLAMATTKNYRELLGHLRILMGELRIEYLIDSNGVIVSKKTNLGMIKVNNKISIIKLNVDLIKNLAKNTISLKSLPKHQSIVEDITFNLPTETAVGPIIQKIKDSSKLIIAVDLDKVWEQNVTFKIEFNSEEHQLTQEEVNKEKEKILKLIP